MTKLSNYLENKLVDHVLRNTAYTPPTALHVALHTADPTEAGNVGEVTTAAYATYARKTLSVGAPTNGVSTNSADLNWTNCPVITISHISIWDAASAGNCLYYGPLTAAQTMASGETFKIPAGSLSIGFD